MRTSGTGRATGLESGDLVPLPSRYRGGAELLAVSGFRGSRLELPESARKLSDCAMEAAFSATAVVGGFVGRDLVLVREWHSYADAMWVFALRFEAEACSGSYTDTEAPSLVCEALISMS